MVVYGLASWNQYFLSTCTVHMFVSPTILHCIGILPPNSCPCTVATTELLPHTMVMYVCVLYL